MLPLQRRHLFVHSLKRCCPLSFSSDRSCWPLNCPGFFLFPLPEQSLFQDWSISGVGKFDVWAPLPDRIPLTTGLPPCFLYFLTIYITWLVLCLHDNARFLPKSCLLALLSCNFALTFALDPSFADASSSAIVHYHVSGFTIRYDHFNESRIYCFHLYFFRVCS